MMNLSELCGRLYDAKQREAAAKAERIELEEAVAALVETPENGSRTVDAAPGLKVNVKRAMGYRADVEAILGLGLADEAAPLRLVPAKYEFDAKAYELIRRGNPALAERLAGCVTATPRKVAVTLKLG